MFSQSFPTTLTYCASIWLAATFAGCGSSDNRLVTVIGNVTFDGQPIAQGNILFIPEEQLSGPQVGASIDDGHYKISHKGGVGAGTYQVRIVAYRNSDGSAGSIDLGSAEQDFEQFIPEQYNDHTTLTCRIDPSAGIVEKNFSLSE